MAFLQLLMLGSNRIECAWRQLVVCCYLNNTVYSRRFVSLNIYELYIALLYASLIIYVEINVKNEMIVCNTPVSIGETCDSC